MHMGNISGGILCSFHYRHAATVRTTSYKARRFFAEADIVESGKCSISIQHVVFVNWQLQVQMLITMLAICTDVMINEFIDKLISCHRFRV